MEQRLSKGLKGRLGTWRKERGHVVKSSIACKMQCESWTPGTQAAKLRLCGQPLFGFSNSAARGHLHRSCDKAEQSYWKNMTFSLEFLNCRWTEWSRGVEGNNEVLWWEAAWAMSTVFAFSDGDPLWECISAPSGWFEEASWDKALPHCSSQSSMGKILCYLQRGSGTFCEVQSWLIHLYSKIRKHLISENEGCGNMRETLSCLVQLACLQWNYKS